MKKVGILYILGFLVGMATGLFIPLSTLFLESKGVSENIIGMISATYFVAMVVGSLIFLKICRKTDAYKLVISALLLAVIAIFVFANSTQIIVYFMCMFVVGLGISFNFITIQNNLAQSDTDDKTKVTGIYAFFFAIGFAVSTALGTILFSISANLAFGVACILLLIDMVIIYKAKLKLGNSEDKSSGSKNKLALFFPFILGGYTYGFIENAFSVFYPIYLKDSYSLKFSGIVLGTFVLGGIVGMLPLSALPAKLGIYKACILFSIGALLGLALIVGTPQKLLFSLIAGACVCVIYPSTLAALNMEHVSSDDVIWATGVYSMFYSIGSACGPLVTGFVMDYTHKGLFIVSGLLIGLFMMVHFVCSCKGGRRMYLTDLFKYKKMVKEMIVQLPDLNEVKDGVYEGFCDAILVKAKIKTTIKDHKIENVELLEHVHEHGEAAEKMIDWINQEKSLEVGMVSGASNSCKVMLKAIENSLKNAVSA